MILLRIGWVFLILILDGFYAKGQYGGAISVEVRDEIYGPVLDADVSAKNEYGQSFRGDVNDSGIYLINGLYPGKYEIHFSRKGYKSVLLQEIKVTENKTTFCKPDIGRFFGAGDSATILAPKKVKIDRYVEY